MVNRSGPNLLVAFARIFERLAPRSFAALRSAQRRGRYPQQLYNDARVALELISTSHEGAVSAFSFYEVEEALYALVSEFVEGVPNVQAIRLAATRPILIQALYAARLFDLKILSLTERAVERVAGLPAFASQGVRVADGLHLMTAADYDADLLLSADRDILRLNGQSATRAAAL
jgi:hypothetical protein